MKMMDVFYNKQGVGDVLIFPIAEGKRNDIQTETFGDIVKITNGAGDVLGYNIFQASQHLRIEQNGKIPLTEKLLDQIKAIFTQANLHDRLEIDLSPKFVIGYVTDKQQHDNADKLSVCQVDVGSEQLQIVCGAANVDKGQKVVVAKVGATMPSGLKIKPTELRGVPSNGMICSKKELDLPMSENETGIYVLDDTYETGAPFKV